MATPFVQQIADWVLRSPDDPFPIVSVIRFDSIEAGVNFKHPEVPHMSVEVTIGLLAELELSATQFRNAVAIQEAFVENAFQVPKGSWPKTIDENLSVKFSNDGTELEFEAGGPAPFERSVEFFLGVDDEQMLRFQPFDASSPVRLHSWVVWRNAVDSLIELNNGGNINLGI